MRGDRAIDARCHPCVAAPVGVTHSAPTRYVAAAFGFLSGDCWVAVAKALGGRMSRMTPARGRVRTWAAGVALALVALGCTAPPPPGGGDPTTTTTTAPATTTSAPSTTSTSTTSTSTTASTSTTTTTTTPPPEDAWTSPWGVSAPDVLAWDGHRVSVDRQGDALLIWTGRNSTTSRSEVQARRKPAGGSPEPILTLDQSGGGFPDVDSDDDGDAAVAWVTSGGGAVKGQRIAADGGLVGPVQQLSTSAPAGRPAVAVAPGGTAMVAWAEIRVGVWYTAARQLNADGSIGPVITLGPSEGSNYPDIAVDRNGQFVVTWARGPEVMAARIGPDSVPSTQVLTAPIASQGPFGYPQVGVDSDGDAVVSYLGGGGGQVGGPVQVWASGWSRAGTVADPINVSSPTDNSGLLHAIATDLEGDSMLVWTHMNSTNRVEMFGRQLSRTGTLGAITSLGEVDYPDIVLDDDGDGLLVFHSPSRRTILPPLELEAHEVGVRTISPSGSFGAPTTLTSDGRTPHVAASPSSRFTVVWQTAAYPQSIQATEGP